MSKSYTFSFAERELDILSKSNTDPDNRPVIEEFRHEILMLCEKFGKSGQSGGSAPYTASAISSAVKKLMLHEPLCPITGIDEEWNDVSSIGGSTGEILYQNKRCSGLFKHADGKASYVDAIVWKGEEKYDTFTGRAMLKNGTIFHSSQCIKGFPFKPKTFYIDVVREILPEDWSQEPFIEWDYYDTKEFEKTGVKNWKKEKYRNIVKDESQLEMVAAYYDLKPMGIK